jgi:hypothetical protein
MEALAQKGSGPLKSLYFSDDDEVLAGRRLKSALSPRPKFGEDVWDLSGCVYRTNAHQSQFQIDFRLIEDPRHRLVLKELIFAALNRRVRGRGRAGTRKISPTTAGSWFHLARQLFRYMESITPGMPLSALTSKLLRGYAEASNKNAYTGAALRPASLAYKLRIVETFQRYEEFLSHDRVDGRIRPPRVRCSSEADEFQDGENLTPRIPEIVEICSGVRGGDHRGSFACER